MGPETFWILTEKGFSALLIQAKKSHLIARKDG
jgi:hypothetical protein